jgi:hypothetical protein
MLVRGEHNSDLPAAFYDALRVHVASIVGNKAEASTKPNGDASPVSG